MKRIYLAIYAAVIRLGLDKTAHFLASAFLALALCVLGIRPVVAGAAVLALGVAKEGIDRSIGGYFDGKDIVADALGTALGLMTYMLTLLT